MKRDFDFLIAVILFIILIPLTTLLILLIKIEDNGPAFFSQKRIGLNQKEFNIIKFRTMQTETHENGIKLSDEQRLTKIGKIIRKLSLDEIPQLLNILKREMNFIGPRPLPPKYLPYYTESENERHKVLPGITGLAQVKGRNLMKWEERFKWDVYYAQNANLWLNLNILIKTVMKVIKKENIVLKENNPLQDLDIERKTNE